MKQSLSYEVFSVRATKEERTASLRMADQKYASVNVHIDIPVEQRCDPGDIIMITVDWPE